MTDYVALRAITAGDLPILFEQQRIGALRRSLGATSRR